MFIDYSNEDKDLFEKLEREIIGDVRRKAMKQQKEAKIENERKKNMER